MPTRASAYRRASAVSYGDASSANLSWSRGFPSAGAIGVVAFTLQVPADFELAAHTVVISSDGRFTRPC